MPIDITPDLIRALESPGAQTAIAQALRTVAVEAVKHAPAEGQEALQPFAKILGCTPRAALARLSRDPELRALGHRLGRPFCSARPTFNPF